jgi:MFS family permease
MQLFTHHPFSRTGSPPKFWLTYVLSIIFNFHGLLVAYSNSSYMEGFTSPEVVGLLYTISSALAVFAFLFFTRILHRFGNVRLTLYLALIEMFALILLGFAFGPATTIIAFVVFMTINPLLYLNIDIFSETLIGSNETGTGSARGLTLALMSIAAALAPFTLALIVGSNTERLHLVYFASAAIFTTFIALILIHFRTFTDPHYERMDVLKTLSGFWQRRNLRNVFLAHFMLQFFFAWTVIYMPLYLATEVGLGWDVIGSIIGVGLLAYAVFEYPIGLLADRHYGEKEMMALGFVVLAITASWISFMASASILAWMVLMFINRAGASLVEVTTESYFFKHTSGSDANIISFFRLTRPLALIAGSLVGSIALLYLPFNLIFVILGLLMAVSIFFVIPLRDTR